MLSAAEEEAKKCYPTTPKREKLINTQSQALPSTEV